MEVDHDLDLAPTASRSADIGWATLSMSRGDAVEWVYGMVTILTAV